VIENQIKSFVSFVKTLLFLCGFEIVSIWFFKQSANFRKDYETSLNKIMSRHNRILQAGRLLSLFDA
jgi:hypothetical protein